MWRKASRAMFMIVLGLLTTWGVLAEIESNRALDEAQIREAIEVEAAGLVRAWQMQRIVGNGAEDEGIARIEAALRELAVVHDARHGAAAPVAYHVDRYILECSSGVSRPLAVGREAEAPVLQAALVSGGPRRVRREVPGECR